MESAEIEVLIEELEQRVERLRALYDQYFMGIEKIEPTVLRKDVDRRFWVLRREQIRNTGLRFKLNTVMQRYNTYQQYWMRICREIENGTYKRDLRRAAKKFGTEALTIQARKRLGKQLERELQEEQQASRERQESDSMDIDVEVEFDDQPAPAPAPAPLPRKKAPVHVISLDALDNLEDVLAMSASHDQAPPREQGRASASSFGDIDDIFGGGGGASSDGSQGPRERGAPAAARSGRPQPAAPPSRTPAPPGTAAPLPRSQAPAQPPQPRKPLPQPPTASAQPPRPSAPAGLGLPRKAPAAATPPPQPAGAPARPSAQPRPSGPTAPPAARAASSDPSLTDGRVREIYAKYVQAKRECRESTSGITEEGLSRSLRATAEKLRSQHKGRQVDFDVVIKDGKAVLKPVVKG